MKNPYWDNVSIIAEKQRKKGIETYEMGIEDNPEDALKRIEMLEEELVDGLMYCEWIKDALSNGKKPLEIRIKYDDGSENSVEVHGDWIDLKASKSVDLSAGEFAVIPLGVAMKLPEGYEAHLAPRSSTFKKWGILQTNGVGVIDNGYCGDGDKWGMPVWATRNTHINKGDRICQFRIVKAQPKIGFVTVDHLDSADRGGFGSTGHGC